MKCEICNLGPPNGPTVYRINEPGEMPARWRCREHLDEAKYEGFDFEFKEIVKILESHGPS